MERKQFTFYESFFRAVSRIRDRQARCEAYDAVCRYALTGALPDLEQTARSGISLLESWLIGLTNQFPLSIGAPLQQNIRELFSGGTALLDKAMTH